MTDPAETRSQTLLPEGVRDDLPPWPDYEAALTGRLMACFARHGYDRVAPPLVEFEDSLLSAAGERQAAAMFRVLDPLSGRMMAIRSDMTLQIARIAATRLAARPRPLRLSYSGHVLRVAGTQLRPARQFRQAGVELIGAAGLAADLEIIGLAGGALGELGVDGLSVDLVSPTLVPALARELGLPSEAAEAARRALDAKDVAALSAFEPPVRDLLTRLMRATGAAESATEALGRLDLPGAMQDGLSIVRRVDGYVHATEPFKLAKDESRMVALAEALAQRHPGLGITLDPGESRGYEYQTGIGFAFFARGGRGELGRGGRYTAIAPGAAAGEPAVGFSMYLDSLLRVAPPPGASVLLYLPCGTPDGLAADLRAKGWRALPGLAVEDDPAAEARRLGCTHILADGKPVPLND